MPPVAPKTIAAKMIAAGKKWIFQLSAKVILIRLSSKGSKTKREKALIALR